MFSLQHPLAPSVDLASLPSGGSGGLSGTPSAPPPITLAQGFPVTTPGDGVAPAWWSTPGNPQQPGGAGAAGGAFGLLQQIANAFTALINQLGACIQNLGNEANAEGPATQQIQSATFSSTGDPHLAENGTGVDANGNPVSVNTKFDSMTAHDDLLSSQDFDGGYRVSTQVTQPRANGITQNQSATVHTNANQDQVTVTNDGSYTITNNGTNVQLGLGQSTTLSGGEIVSRNMDGSLTVTEQNAQGGLISTTMSANGSGGVDVNASVQNASVGGDIASGNAAGNGPAPAPPLWQPGTKVRDTLA